MAAKKAISLIVGLVVMVLLAAFLAPVAIDQLEGDTSTTITQDTSETVDVNPELNSTLDSVTAGTSAEYTLSSDGASETNTINVGENATYSFDRGDVVVTVDEANSGNATATYEHERDYAYSSGASSLWGLLGLAVVLAIILYTLMVAMKQNDF